MNKTDFIGIRIEPALKAKCQVEAKRDRRSLSSFITGIVDVYFKRRKGMKK